MKEPKFKLGQKVYGIQCRNNEGEHEVVSAPIIAIHIFASGRLTYDLDDAHRSCFNEEELSSSWKEAKKIANRETLRRKIKHIEWDRERAVNSVNKWQENIAKGPVKLKEAEGWLKKADKELIKLKKKLEKMS